MQMNDAIKNSIHAHYSPSYKYSVGYKGEYFRKDQIALNGIQLNNLIKRWNLPASQGNLYLESNIGNLHTWLMLQASHQPEFKGDKVIATPLVRIFKGAHLAEFGVSPNKRILFNFIARF